jgi:hypothetical protein
LPNDRLSPPRICYIAFMTRLSSFGFTAYTLPNGQIFPIPKDVRLRVPGRTSLSTDLLHFLVYIPWQQQYLAHVPGEYRDFFTHLLPYLHSRTTDVHVALCLPYVRTLAAKFSAEIDLRTVYVAFILHDIGWSQMTEQEIAASLGVQGLALTGGAVAPKEKHAVAGKALAQQILTSYPFSPPLDVQQRSLIFDAILYHDRPWELALNGDVPNEVKLACDVDHLWSFTHQNFWQDTVRKGVAPAAYIQNLATDLDGYFLTGEAKAMARKMLAERAAEVRVLGSIDAIRS